MIDFKHEEDIKLFFTLHPILQMILMDGAWWAYERGLDYTITATVSTLKIDQELGRKSPSHREKRASDLRSRNWPQERKVEFKKYLGDKYGEFSAVNSKGEKRLVVLHDSGHGEHFHIQIHSKFKL